MAMTADEEGAGDILSWHRSCQERDGVLIGVELQGLDLGADAMAATSVLVEQLSFGMDLQEGQVPVCVPPKCATLADKYCAQLKGWLIKETMRQSKLSMFTPGDPWLLKGVPTAAASQARMAFAAPRPPPAPQRALVVSHHGALAALLAEHLETAAAGSHAAFDIAIYASCYLCSAIAKCRELQVPSAADRACDAFHNGSSFEESQAMVRDIIAREQARTSLVMCFGLQLCYFLFALLQASVVRMQLLCMNPLQGVPEEAAGPVLLDLRSRAGRGDLIYATNEVTRKLLGYHAGVEVAATVQTVTLFPWAIHEWGRRATWAGVGRPALLVMAFQLGANRICWAFRDTLRHILGDEALVEAGGGDGTLATNGLLDEVSVAALLQHTAAVYLPEVPYKNHFNGLYAAALPLFVPALAFLARLWPQVFHTEWDQVYDGWFDRRISRVQVGSSSRGRDAGEPEPFDLDTGGEEKVAYWMGAADYFSFPGILLFNGAADLAARLSEPEDFPERRTAMRQHAAAGRRAALAAFEALAGRASLVG